MSDQYREDTQQISITFPVGVNVSQDQMQRIIEIVSKICDEWEERHPDSVMWPAGVGGQITSMPITKEDEESGVPLSFDMSVLHIECCERELLEDEKHHWMNAEEAKKLFPRLENPPIYCKRCGRPSTTKRHCQQVKVGPRHQENNQ